MNLGCIAAFPRQGFWISFDSWHLELHRVCGTLQPDDLEYSQIETCWAITVIPAGFGQFSYALRVAQLVLKGCIVEDGSEMRVRWLAEGD